MDAGKVTDPCSAGTTVVVDANYSLTATFIVDPDATTGGSIYVDDDANVKFSECGSL